MHERYFYVGFTQNVSRRLRSHFQGEGAVWTRLHSPCSVLEVSEGGHLEERLKTLEIMSTYGWHTTRGSHWCARDLKAPPRELSLPHAPHPVLVVPPPGAAGSPPRTKRRAAFRALRTLATLAAAAVLTAAVGMAVRVR